MNTFTAISVPGPLRQAAKRFKVTKRELEVLVLLCEGEPWKGIQDKLGIHQSTVRFHCHNLCAKTKAANPIMALAVILLRPVHSHS